MSGGLQVHCLVRSTSTIKFNYKDGGRPHNNTKQQQHHMEQQQQTTTKRNIIQNENEATTSCG